MLPPPHPNLLRTDADPLSRCRPVFPPGAGKRTAELWAADAEFRQRFHRLVSDDELQRAGSAIEEARKQWAAVSGDAALNGKRWDSLRADARRSLETQLTEIVPHYAEVRALQRTHLRKLIADLPRPPYVTPIVAPDVSPATLFTAPFGLARTGTVSTWWVESMDIVDRSFVRRDIGQLFVDADLAADPGSVWESPLTDDLVPLDSGSVSAAAGSAYTLPQAGQLLVTASLRNIYSRVTLRLRDEWGFSSGEMRADVSIFLAVLRPQGGEFIHSLLAARNLDSDGDSVSAELPDIDQRTFPIRTLSTDSFEAGESVFVLAGVCVRTGSALNDMEAHTRALLWWVLQELTVLVVS